MDVVLAPWRAARAVVRLGEELNALADAIHSLDRHAAALDRTARTIVVGGEDLRRTGESLDAHTVELITGGRELTETAKAIADQLAVTETSLETVADTVEPLQGLTNGVGRVARRLSPSD
jgi:gamma-glutamyl phosphate reductase